MSDQGTPRPSPDPVKPGPDDTDAQMIARATAAQDRGDWDAAVQLWATFRTAFPDRLDGYDAGVRCLDMAGRAQDADNLLGDAVDKFPGNERLTMDHAWRAHHRRDWNAALPRWAKARTRFPGRAELGEAASLSAAGQAREADAVLQAMIDAQPHNPAYWVPFALQAQNRGDLAAALPRWQAVRDRFPGQRLAYLFGAWCLRDNGQRDEADAVLAAGLSLFPGDLAIATEFARLAMAAEQWTEAARRWSLVRVNFPDDESAATQEQTCLQRAGAVVPAEAGQPPAPPRRARSKQPSAPRGRRRSS